jgi:uncharacterized phage protein (TIGR02218 family)
MRVIDTAFQAHLDGGATTLCRCWLVRRADGVAFGFSDHDDDLAFGRQIFRAASGMDASALKSATGLSVDNASVIGALSDAGVTEADIRAGRFDAAEVTHWLVNWRDPEQRVLLFRGKFGEISRADGGFEVELRGPAEALNLSRGRSILRRCDAALGDARCGVDPAGPAISTVAVVRSGGGGRITVGLTGDFDAGWFTGGSLAWESGANLGLKGQIRADEADAEGHRIFRLWEEVALPVSEGDRALVVAGCDKLATTCRKKFDNFLNFRGFPDIPGEDWVTAYPKDGEVHDGRSRSR